MITKEQALTENEFHYHIDGMKKCEVWRRNGKTQVWKTRPNDFRIPVKHGLYNYDQIRHFDSGFHAASDCPYREQTNG